MVVPKAGGHEHWGPGRLVPGMLGRRREHFLPVSCQSLDVGSLFRVLSWVPEDQEVTLTLPCGVPRLQVLPQTAPS